MIRDSKFWGQDGKRYWARLDPEQEVKLIAKMFREITHMKPPRGRPGRHLPFDGHFAVRAIQDSYTQGQFTAEEELSNLENRGENAYRPMYTQGEAANDQDIRRLEDLHVRYINKTAVQNTVNSLQDLIQGLMGLGLRGEVRYDEVGYTTKQYQATMVLDGFVITIKKVGDDDS